MNLETLKKANELNAAIQDRIKYGEKLNTRKEEQEKDEKNFLSIRIEYYNHGEIQLRDIDEMDLLETSIARNETHIKKLQKEFDNLKTI